MTLRILSLDFDGCLFHKRYLRSTRKQILQHNMGFLQAIKSQNKAFDKAIVFVGSNRQSLAIDITNSAGKGSCFPAIKRVANYLSSDKIPVTHDPFLMADLYAKIPFGSAYAAAMEHPGIRTLFKQLPPLEKSAPFWVFDDSKLTILYAQIHKIATENPMEPTVFDFYDDRWDILEGLESFFETYKELIPSHIKLRLHHYDGHDITPISYIQGTGHIDINYQETVREMAHISLGKNTITKGDRINAALSITPRFLTQRRLIPHQVPVSTEARLTTDKKRSPPPLAIPTPDVSLPEAMREPDELSPGALDIVREKVIDFDSLVDTFFSNKKRKTTTALIHEPIIKTSVP